MGSDRAIWYDINHSLPSKAKQKVSIFYASGCKINWNYRNFIDHLKRTFGNKKEKEDMQEMLSNLKQKENQRFSDFFPVFDEALAGAGGENWPEDNKVVWLRRSLSEALKDQLFTVELDPEDYYGSVRRIETVAYRFENSRHFKGKKGPSQSIDIPPSNGNQLPAPRLDQDGDVIMSPMNSSGQGGRNSQWKRQGAQQKYKENQASGSKAPQTQQRAAFVDKAELEFRNKNKLCIRCGTDAHFVPSCPFLPPIRPHVGINSTDVGIPHLLENDRELNLTRDEGKD